MSKIKIALGGTPILSARTMVSENWPTLLLPGLRKIFHTRLRARESLFKRTEIYPTDTSQKEKEQYQGIGELGTDGWDEFERTGRTSMDEFEPTWKTDLVHREFTKGLSVRRKLMDDIQYADAGIPKSLTQKVEKLASSAAVKREKSAASVFNTAFTDTGTDFEGFSVSGADGVGLCSTAHPASPTNSATQSNEGTLALTKANVKATSLLMREFTDDRGELTAVLPDTLLVPPELAEAAEVINRSELLPGSANNDVNTQKGRWNIIEWDYLTDADAWFEIDSGLKADHLVWLDRILPEFESEKDKATQVAEFFGYMRYSRGFDAWQWIYGQNAS